MSKDTTPLIEALRMQRNALADGIAELHAALVVLKREAAEKDARISELEHAAE